MDITFEKKLSGFKQIALEKVRFEIEWSEMTKKLKILESFSKQQKIITILVLF